MYLGRRKPVLFSKQDGTKHPEYTKTMFFPLDIAINARIMYPHFVAAVRTSKIPVVLQERLLEDYKKYVCKM